MQKLSVASSTVKAEPTSRSLLSTGGIRLRQCYRFVVGEGLVDSLARPNGNTTGVSILANELDGKRQELLIEAVSGLRRMAVLADSNVTAIATLNEMRAAARARNIELSIYRVAHGDEISAAIDMAASSGVTALNVLASPMLNGNHQLILQRVAELRVPTMYQWPEIAEEGGFIGYGPRLGEIFRELVDPIMVKLFRRTKVANIPVEQPTKFELVINLKTAKALGLVIPEPFLIRADELIE
jgi:putative ABC transport system substrate-binding protein